MKIFLDLPDLNYRTISQGSAVPITHHRCARTSGLSVVMAVATLSLAAASVVSASETSPDAIPTLRPRSSLSSTSTSSAPALAQQLVVKFKDSVKARADEHGGIASLSGANLTEAVVLSQRYGARFSPLIQLPGPTLEFLETRAAVRSGVQQPDLAGMLVLEITAPTIDVLAAAVRDFQRLSSVEFAFIQPLGIPPPTDIPPATPDLVSLQNYRGPNPGMDIDYAWGQGGRGAGVRISDCEYGWNAAHEDLNDLDLHLEPGQVINPQVFALGYDEHGTAVLGELSAAVNVYGCTGMVPDAEVHTYPEWTVQGFRRVTAITNAIANSDAGDVVLLEMQAFGAGGGNNYVPAEYDPAVWVVVKNGTDAGVIVVAAAGNGNQDLDSPPYQEYMSRGDSGAIIIGAGTANTQHVRLSFSTYGSRVNVQGWGQSVFSIGYGSYAEYGGDKNQRYTSTFSGTSSASPFAAAASIALQSIARESDADLSPLGMRDLLIDTGIPQGPGGHIGPFVSMSASIPALGARLPQCDAAGPYAGVVGVNISFDGAGSSDPDGAITTYEWNFGDGGTGFGPAPDHAYESSGIFTVELSVADDQGNTHRCTTMVDVNALPICDAGGPYVAPPGEEIQFDGSGSSDPDGAVVLYEWSFGDGSTGSGPAPTHVYLASGAFTIDLTVSDNRSGQSICQTTAVIDRAPLAEANGPYLGNVGQAIDFSSAGSGDPDGDPLAYSWDFGDGTTATEANPSHTFVAGGDIQVMLRVTDPLGLFHEDSAAVHVNRPPVAEANGPYAGGIGEPILFSSTGSGDPDGDALTYHWDFGDGMTSTEASPTHAYSEADTFVVALTVFDPHALSGADATVASVQTSTSLPLAALPTTLALHPLHPNPFHAHTRIRFDLPERSRVRLAIYDVAGTAVRYLETGEQGAGTHDVYWDGADESGQRVGAGIYFCRFEHAGQVITRKLVLLK